MPIEKSNIEDIVKDYIRNNLQFESVFTDVWDDSATGYSNKCTKVKVLLDGKEFTWIDLE